MNLNSFMHILDFLFKSLQIGDLVEYKNDHAFPETQFSFGRIPLMSEDCDSCKHIVTFVSPGTKMMVLDKGQYHVMKTQTLRVLICGTGEIGWIKFYESKFAKVEK